jgi:hypothetical protein
VSVPVVALKTTEDPDATLTVAGTVRAVLSRVMASVIPPAGTAFDRVTAQELLPFDPRVAGVHTSEVTVTGATRLTDALAEEPM